MISEMEKDAPVFVKPLTVVVLRKCKGHLFFFKSVF